MKHVAELSLGHVLSRFPCDQRPALQPRGLRHEQGEGRPHRQDGRPAHPGPHRHSQRRKLVSPSCSLVRSATRIMVKGEQYQKFGKFIFSLCNKAKLN